MSSKREKYYHLLCLAYLSQGENKGSKRAFCREKNLSPSTFTIWFNRLYPQRPDTSPVVSSNSTSKLLPFELIADAPSSQVESVSSQIKPNTTLGNNPYPTPISSSLINIQLTMPNQIVVDIPKITLLDISELINSLLK